MGDRRRTAAQVSFPLPHSGLVSVTAAVAKILMWPYVVLFFCILCFTPSSSLVLIASFCIEGVVSLPFTEEKTLQWWLLFYCSFWPMMSIFFLCVFWSFQLILWLIYLVNDKRNLECESFYLHLLNEVVLTGHVDASIRSHSEPAAPIHWDHLILEASHCLTYSKAAVYLSICSLC